MLSFKKILYLIAIILPIAGKAQYYQCVLDSSINYFTNTDDYLRAIRIDSIKTVNGNKVLYPFKTARGDYYNVALRKGGSWLGETITILPDGTHYFSNYRNDTLVIKTSAILNDSWLFYDDTSFIRYEATVTTEDTMTVLGVLDSVKTISITAKDSSGAIVPDIYNGRVLILSKNHGFVRCFDVYNFPSQLNHGYDYYNYKAGGLDFDLVSFHNPTKLELYDYQVGDRFQRWDWMFQNVYSPSYTTLLVLDKFVLSPVEINYRILKTIEKKSIYPPYKIETILSVYTLTADTALLFDMKRLPEEWGMERFMKYNPSDSDFCFVDKSYAWWVNYVYFSSDSANVNTFEPCSGPNYSYKLGAGETSYSYCYDPVGFNPSWFLKHVYKNSTACGPYFTLSVDNSVVEHDDVKVFPNPVGDYLSIETNYSGCNAILKDIAGRVVYESSISQTQNKLDVRSLTAGAYLLQLRDALGRVSNHKIIIAR